jgi:hypothetical protein
MECFNGIKNSKDLIVEFMKLKDKIIFNLTEFHLYNDDDYAEVATWADSKCKKMRLNASSDHSCCPSCIIFSNRCLKCSYGYGHGNCKCYYSLYGSISRKLWKVHDIRAFCCISSIDKLIDKFNCKQEELLLYT